VGDLDEAIREHLELKRRRGADPAEVAREEQEALSPVTRGHAIVVADPPAPEPEGEKEPAQNEDAAPRQDSTKPPPDEDQDDATQEFRVEFGPSSDDWLDEEQ
jgi:hypothetical protein